MKEKDEITDLFRCRLKQMQMEVRDGFWESLQQDLRAVPVTPDNEKKQPVGLWLHPLTAAASVLLVLGMVSAICWYLSPSEEIQQAFTQVQGWQPQPEAGGDGFSSSSSSAAAAIASSCSFRKSPIWGTESSDTAGENVSVRFSITVRQQMHESVSSMTEGYERMVSSENLAYKEPVNMGESGSKGIMSDQSLCGKWAFKVSFGTALPKGGFHAPVVAGVSVERKLGKCLSLESGLQYHRLTAEKEKGQTMQALAVPVKLNIVLADSKRWQCYASVGGAVEKILNKGFNTDPLRLSVSAGIGVSYKMNEKLAFFMEPGVSHHFETESNLKNLRTERATNMNLLCGMRIIY